MTYENVKNNIYPRLLNASLSDKFEVYYPADAVGFDDLIIVPFLQSEDKAVDKEMMKIWGVDRETIMYDGFNNAKERAKISTLLGIDTVHLSFMNYGAIASIILEPELVDRFPNGYIIIPSSVHECLVMANDGAADNDHLTRIIQEVNATLRDFEVLSEHPYYFV